MTNIAWSGGEEFRSKCVIGMERDGVLNVYLDYCAKPEDFKEIPKSIQAVVDLRNKGYKIVIITDQRGVDQGHMTKEDVEKVNDELMKLLGMAGCFSIDGLYYSIGTTKPDPWVKPNTGMFKRCEKEHTDVKFKTGYYVGHTIRDLKSAVAVGAIPVLVRTGKGIETEQELNKFTYRNIKQKTKIFDNLDAFAKSLK